MNERRRWSLSAQRMGAYSVAFVLTVVLARNQVQASCSTWGVGDCPLYWPLSVFLPRWPSSMAWLWAGALLGLARFGVEWLDRRRFRILETLTFGVVFCLGTTLLQGPTWGFSAPVAGESINRTWVANSERGGNYWLETPYVRSVHTYLMEYTQRQRSLGLHAQTHPTGAVLFTYGARRLLATPAMITLVMGMLCLFAIGGAFFWLARSDVDDEEAGYWALLLLLLPAVQIYGVWALESVVAALILGAVAVSRVNGWLWAVLGTGLLLAVAGLLTFGVLFAGPVLAGREWVERRTLWRTTGVALVVVGLYTWIWWDSDFNYWTSFQIATAIENPAGFRWLADPADYILSRLEGFGEVFLFFGPILTVGWVQSRGGLGGFPRPTAWIGALGWATFAMMLAAGAFRTGETARTCLFVTPLMLAAVLGTLNPGRSTRRALLYFAIVQTVLMQLFGFFVW